MGTDRLAFGFPKLWQVLHHSADSLQHSVAQRQHHKLVMNAVLILEAKVRRSYETKSRVVGRITKDNHGVISGLPARGQSFADQL